MPFTSSELWTVALGAIEKRGMRLTRMSATDRSQLYKTADGRIVRLRTSNDRLIIQKLWQSYEKDMTAVDYQTVEVIDAGDYAIQFGKYDATYQGKPDQGRYITVWKKDGDSWKIVRDSWYSNPMQ